MVNVDTVYQRVLALTNKEQRGYITPQEFNLLANQAQMMIFEQYFYDLNKFLIDPGMDTMHADIVDILEEKISIFERSDNLTLTTNTGSLNSLNRFLIIPSYFINNNPSFISTIGPNLYGGINDKYNLNYKIDKFVLPKQISHRQHNKRSKFLTLEIYYFHLNNFAKKNKVY